MKKYTITNNSVIEKETGKTIYISKNESLIRILCDQLNRGKISVKDIMCDCFACKTHAGFLY